MGAASSRGTFDQRRVQAIQRKQAEHDAARAKRELRKQQEDQAWNLMVWWQVDMTIDRYNRIRQRRSNSQLVMAQFLGMAYGGGWGGFGLHR